MRCIVKAVPYTYVRCWLVKIMTVYLSVVDPTSLNLDGILAQFGSGSESRVIHTILKEKIKKKFREKQFSLKKGFF